MSLCHAHFQLNDEKMRPLFEAQDIGRPLQMDDC